MQSLTRPLTTVIGLCFATLLGSATFSAAALTPGDRVDNFTLLDHLGNAHELYYQSDKKAVVIMIQGNGCPIVRNTMPRFKALRDQFSGQNVAFLLLNANLQDNRTSIAMEANEFGFDMPILVDDTQLIAESLGVIRTGEVFVIDPDGWRLTYRGAVDDRLNYEVQKSNASEHYLQDALIALVNDGDPAIRQTDAIGCLVNLAEKSLQSAYEKISYAETIAPMLEENCLTCHRPDGIGPWAMTDFNMVRGFAPMIREVVRTKRMPPWHADPHYGEFSNDRSLTVAETQTLVHWIEAGAPRGEGPDPLAQHDHDWPDWTLGQPDLVIEIPEFDVPATGVVDYQFVRAKNTLDHDVWVRATEILPGDRSVLHHVITSFSANGDFSPRARGRRGRGGLGGYVPGSGARVLPAGTGTLLPAGATIQFQMHYTPYGKAVTDRSQLGLYFHEQPPKHRMGGTLLINFRFRIPPHDPAFTASATQVVPRDALLYSLLPHSHYRGKASEFRAVYPNGTEEILLSVPNYDFNWQTTYWLKEPKVLPAGTRLVHSTTWDNSAQNPANPDPDRAVGWGRQSWDEMLFGAVGYRFLDKDDQDQKVDGNETVTVANADL